MKRTSTAIKTLALGRIAIGLIAWVKPSLAAKLLGLTATRHTSESYLWRLFGIRDAVIGAGTLTASREQLRTWLMLGIVCDTADGFGAALGRPDGDLQSASVALMAIPAAAAALGVLAVRSGTSTPS